MTFVVYERPASAPTTLSTPMKALFAALFGLGMIAAAGTGGSTAPAGEVLDFAAAGTGGSTAPAGEVLDFAGTGGSTAPAGEVLDFV